MIDPLPEPPNPRMNPHCQRVIKAHMRALDRVLDLVEDCEYEGHDKEFGVLYVGGGRDWQAITAGCLQLRGSGYSGPVEVWYGHTGDSDPVDRDKIRWLDVEVVNTLEVAQKTKSRVQLGSAEARLYAIRHCRYRKLLFLEPEAYCTVDPQGIILGTQNFSFWTREEFSRIFWDRVWRDSKRDVPDVHGGQLLLDREKDWRLICVADWICQHGDFYFRHLRGDGDAWRLALSVTEYDYTLLGELQNSVARYKGLPFISRFRRKPDGLSQIPATIKRHDPLPLPVGGFDPESPEIIDLHENALKKMVSISRVTPYPGHDYDFTILYVGGGKYWPGVVVGCKLLRLLGYKGRIEVWHGHQGNPEPVDEEDVRGLDVKIVYAPGVSDNPRIMRGFESKIYALKHCRAKRVFFLDADAYFVVNPDEVVHKFNDFTYWIDIIDRTKWEKVWRGDRREVPPFQGGQFFIDREACWPLIYLSDWLCQHSDFYFRHLYTDQEAVRLALSILREIPFQALPIGFHRRRFFLCHYDNRAATVHRIASKLFPPVYWDRWTRERGAVRVLYDPTVPLEDLVHYLYSRLCHRKYGMVETFQTLYRNRCYVGDEHNEHNSWLAKRIADWMASKGYYSVLDAGCGNGKFSEELLQNLRRANPNATLVGCDCVREVLPSGLRQGTYYQGDITKVDTLPVADVILAKDVLAQWGTPAVEQWLSAVTASGKWKALVLTTSTRQEIVDIPHGSFRGLDPRLFPLARFAPWEIVRYGEDGALLMKTLQT